MKAIDVGKTVAIDAVKKLVKKAAKKLSTPKSQAAHFMVPPEEITKKVNEVIAKYVDTSAINLNPLDARSRYTDFAQTSLRCQKAVYRRHGMLLHAPEVGIPAARCIYASCQKTVYRLCFLMHTGPSIPKS